jgi:hypothetical protein
MTYNWQEYLRAQKEIKDICKRPAGNVIIMGSNKCLQLWRPYEVEEAKDKDDKLSAYLPKQVHSLPLGKCIQVAAGCGILHTAALTVDRHAFTWGNNADGALACLTESEVHFGPAPVSGPGFTSRLPAHAMMVMMWKMDRLWPLALEIFLLFFKPSMATSMRLGCIRLTRQESATLPRITISLGSMPL